MSKFQRIVISMFVVLLIFIIPLPIFASVYISEIMYDIDGSDSGREWVEIYNDSDTEADMKGWKLLEGDKSHNSFSADSSVVPAHSYAVIADNKDMFLADWPTFEGYLFDAAFSLTNTELDITLKDASGSVVDTVHYDGSVGAAGDGNSLQKVGDEFVVGEPTPGKENTNIPIPVEEEDEDDDDSSTASSTVVSINTSSHSSYVSASSAGDVSYFKVNIGRKRLGFVGDPLEFKSVVVSKGLSETPRFVWSYGDGGAGKGETTSYTYDFPGEYTVVVNGKAGDETAVAKTTVLIVEPNVAFGKNTKDFIEIQNLSESEININYWVLKNNSSEFEFPIDTIIQPKATITISAKIAGFEFDNSAKTTLSNQSGIVMAEVGTDSVTAPEIGQESKRQEEITRVSADIARITDEVFAFQNKYNSEILAQSQKNKVATTPQAVTIDADASKEKEEDEDTYNNKTQTAAVIEVFEVKKTDGFFAKVIGAPSKAVKYMKNIIVGSK